MSYRRNFTIGRRETRNFYLTLVLGSWRKGIAGFGAVGALAALLYMPALSLPLRGLLLLAGAAAGMGLSTLFLAVSTCLRVRAQLRRSGRERYVQETEIDGFGVRVTVGSRRPGGPSTCSSPTARPGSFPRPRWRTGRRSAPSCGRSSAP